MINMCKEPFWIYNNNETYRVAGLRFWKRDPAGVFLTLALVEPDVHQLVLNIIGTFVMGHDTVFYQFFHGCLHAAGRQQSVALDELS